MARLNISNQAQKHFFKKDKVKGQFFTPPEVADFIVSLAAKYVSSQEKTACDPACGDGVFLSSLLKHGFLPFGVDIDEDILNSLPNGIKKFASKGDGLLLNEDRKFALVVGNPPFSAKYGRVRGEILKNFDLGRGPSQAIEILFLEKFVRLCKDGGVIGIILPHGIFSDTRLSYVREFIKSHLMIIAIVSLPRNIFKGRESRTSSKTCILLAKKERKSFPQEVLFASIMSPEELATNDIKRKTFAFPEEFLYPEFYLQRNPLLENLPKLKQFNIEIIQGKAKYGEERKFSPQGIPFISAKVVTPLGIDFSRDKKFVQQGSSMDCEKAYTKVGDVLFVRVGVGCIGRTAVVTNESEVGIADDWIYIIRIKDNRLSPYFLALWLQTTFVQAEIRRLSRGVGTITIPISLVKEIPILDCDKELQDSCEGKYKEMVSLRKRGLTDEAFQIRQKILEILERRMLLNNSLKGGK